jgi:hypothetical protein
MISHLPFGLVCFGLILVVSMSMKLFAVARGADAPDGPRGKVTLTSTQQMILLPVMLGLPVLLLAGGFFVEYRKLVGIREHGARAEAVVDGVYRQCGKHSCSRHVRYHYVPLAGQSSMTGDERLGRDADDDPHVAYVQRTGHVPIAYDTAHPGRSALNFDDDVFSAVQEGRVLGTLRALGIAMTVLFGILAEVTMARALFAGRRRPA